MLKICSVRIVESLITRVYSITRCVRWSQLREVEAVRKDGVVLKARLHLCLSYRPTTATAVFMGL